VAALFFLAFAFFAVGQASVTRNSAQTAADASALAAARATRDGIKAEFLAALKDGDIDKLAALLNGEGMDGANACAAATNYANDNRADRTDCERVDDPPGYTIGIRTQGTVGKSVAEGTETMHATATATAVVDPRCTADEADGSAVIFTCDGDEVTVDPTDGDFTLNLAEFFSVHLSE
jgi:Flp pilus assembly protein TadG